MAGFPKKNQEMKLYRDKDRKSYFLLIIEHGQPPGHYGAVANALDQAEPPSLCYTGITDEYIREHYLKRMQWNEIPQSYQDAFMRYMNSDPEYPFDPAKVRGLWRVGSQRA